MTARKPIPGGHKPDGGFAMIEPTAADRDRLAERMISGLPEVYDYQTAAEELVQVTDLVAHYGSNVPLAERLRTAEGIFDAARASAHAVLYPSDTNPKDR